METTASILVNGRKQKMYFGDTVFLNDNTEFDIEFFNTSQKTVCPSVTINGESLTSSPVIYNGQKYVLKDFINDNRRFLFKTYTIDKLDPKALNAIKDNGIVAIKYYYEKIYIPSKTFYDTSEERIHSDFSMDESIEETGKIMRGSRTDTKYKTVNIQLDYSNFEEQIIKILPISKKPENHICSQCKTLNSIENNFCPNCGHRNIL
jgi:hypothetical protein